MATPYNRQQPDLTKMVAELSSRLKKLETLPRIGASAIDAGQLTLKGGDIVVANADGEVVLQILHGDVPEIRMNPSGSPSDYRAYVYGWDSDTLGTSLQAGVENGSGAQDGGKLLLMQTGAYFSYQPQVGDEAYLSLGALGGLDDGLYFRGRWPNNVVIDGYEALAMGSVNVSAGVSSYSHTYAVPFASSPGVVYGLLNSAGAVTHSLTASSNTGFTIAWTGTLAKTIFWWTFRM